MKEIINALSIGLLVGASVMGLLVSNPNSKSYYRGRDEVMKEAFIKGFSIKEIDKDDKVQYIWAKSNIKEAEQTK